MADAALPAAGDVAARLVRAFEGCRLAAYRDAVGYWTIGWGHLMTRDKTAELGGTAIDQAEADRLLAGDLAPAIGAVARLIAVPVSAAEAGALTSFVFNLGGGALQGSGLRLKLNRGDRVGAADEFPKWCLAGGRRLPGLVRRRAAERATFLSG